MDKEIKGILIEMSTHEFGPSSAEAIANRIEAYHSAELRRVLEGLKGKICSCVYCQHPIDQAIQAIDEPTKELG